MLKEQLRRFAEWSDELRAKLTLVVVDDCSDKHPIDCALLSGCGLDVKAFWIKEKHLWNWRGAKNIAMKECPKGWTIVTDIDHVLPAEEAEKLFKRTLDEGNAYYFKRRTPFDHREQKPHSSTRLITRGKFWETGGYDESFVGTQSGWVGEYPRRVKKVCKTPTLPIYIERYEHGEIADANVPLPRGGDVYRDKTNAIKATWKGVKTLTFPYERLI